MNSHDAMNAIGYGLGVIQMERARQVTKHDWTPEHDDQYVDGELLLYAQYWMTPVDIPQAREHAKQVLQSLDTAGWEDESFKYDERTPEERLARAGALIAAEIDRVKRAAQKQQ